MNQKTRNQLIRDKMSTLNVSHNAARMLVLADERKQKTQLRTVKK